MPTLVLHGTDDPRVPVELAEQLAAAEPELVTLERVPDALHVETWNFGPEDWKDT